MYYVLLHRFIIVDIINHRVAKESVCGANFSCILIEVVLPAGRQVILPLCLQLNQPL